MFDSIWFASKECCTIWVRSVKDPRRHPPRNTTAITRCNNGVLLVRVHVMSCSNPRLTLLPSARVPLTTCNSGRVVPAVSVWSRRPAGAAFDAIVLGAATFSPSFLVVSCLRNHCLGRIVFASVQELVWSVPLRAVAQRPTLDSWRFLPRPL